MKSPSSNGPIGWLAPSFIAASIPAISETPSILMKAASLIIGIRIRFTTKPAASLTCTGVLPISSAIFLIASTVSTGVLTPAITSTNFIRSAGLKKCIPINGRVSPFPISVIESDDVFEAKIHSGLAILSNSANVVFLTCISSKAASTMRSQSLQRSSFKQGVMLARMLSTFSCVIFSFATSLAYPFAILSFPPSAHSCLISQSATSYPSTCANAFAIPWPIVPAPITPTFILIPPKIYYGAKALSAKPLQHNLIIYIN